MCKILKNLGRTQTDETSYFPSMISVILDVAILPHVFVNHSLHTAEKNFL